LCGLVVTATVAVRVPADHDVLRTTEIETVSCSYTHTKDKDDKDNAHRNICTLSVFDWTIGKVFGELQIGDL
jgi:hypothetical protein